MFAAWRSVLPRFEIEFDDFCQSLSGWDCHPVHVDGAVVGAILVNGPEIHACVIPEVAGRWMSRSALRVLNDVIDKNGYARTTATTDKGREFVERLGFELVGDEYVRSTKWALKRD